MFTTTPTPPLRIAGRQPTASRLRICLAGACLVLLAVLAYLNTFSVPFIFDDLWSIPYNESIQHFSTALSPPNTNGETVSGRPLVNLSLAVNYAISHNHVWSYHGANLLIHVCAGLALFGLVRRTLALPSLRERFGRAALPVATVAAALWLLHPMQTESVTYLVQRAESLMALFYLLTLYCFIRAVENPRRSAWLAASVAACLLGMASKEVMVSAPLMVLFFDRAFVSGSFREAWSRRRTFYLALASTWILTVWLALNTGNRGTTAGFGAGVSTWTYLLTQMQAIPHYLRLAFWPRGLVFDYGTPLVTRFGDVWPQALLLAALLGATAWAFVKRPKLGFLGAFFFAVLAPTSSFIPVATQTIATHRMYLPLAAVMLGGVLALWSFAENRKAQQRRGAWIFAACGVVALVLAVLTFQRNAIYQNNITLWADTLEKLPDKDRARAHNNLANALVEDGRAEEAIPHCIEAVRLKPDFPQAFNNHGFALAKLGRYNDALWFYDKSLSFGQAGIDVTLNNRGYALYNLGRLDEAVSDYRASLKIRPAYAEARSNYANVLCALSQYDDALTQIDEALRLEPDFAAAWNNRGNVFAALGQQPDEALRCYKRAVELDPTMVLAVDNVARYSLVLGRAAEALPYFEMQASLTPDKALVQQGWGNALMLLGRQAESIPHFQRALELDATLIGSRQNLAIALLNTGHAADALPHFEKAITLQPGMAPLRHNYAGALAQLGRLGDAIAQEREALRIQPGFAWAQEQLDTFLKQQQSYQAQVTQQP